VPIVDSGKLAARALRLARALLRLEVGAIDYKISSLPPP
jgi:hypothetical protein